MGLFPMLVLQAHPVTHSPRYTLFQRPNCTHTHTLPHLRGSQWHPSAVMLLPTRMHTESHRTTVPHNMSQVPRGHGHALPCIHTWPMRTPGTVSTNTCACSGLCSWPHCPVVCWCMFNKQPSSLSCHWDGAEHWGETHTITSCELVQPAPAHHSTILCRNHMINLSYRWAAPKRAAPGQQWLIRAASFPVGGASPSLASPTHNPPAPVQTSLPVPSVEGDGPPTHQM